MNTMISSVPTAPTDSMQSDTTNPRDLEEGKEQVELESPGDATHEPKQNHLHNNGSHHRPEPDMLAGYHHSHNHPNPQQQVRDTRQLQGMAKMWDEEDRMAKQKGGRRSSANRAGLPQPAGSLTSDSHHSVPDPPTNGSSVPVTSVSLATGTTASSGIDYGNVRRMSEADAKRRATFLSTGLKPGAYPDRGPLMDDDDGVNLPLGATSRQYATQFSSDGLMDKSNTAVSKDGDDTTADGDLEEGQNNNNSNSEAVMYDNNGPLVEAFVVPDEEDNERSSMPPLKGGTHTPSSMMVAGDGVQKPGPITNHEEVKVTDLLLHRNMLCLIGSLICCFVVAAVIVVVVVMVVVVPDSNNDPQGSLTTVTSSNNSNVVVDGSPTTNPISTLLPEVNDPATLDPVPETPTTVEDGDDDQEVAETDPVETLEPTAAPTDGDDDDQEVAETDPVEALEPTPAPTDGDEEQVAEETHPVETLEPTAAPTDGDVEQVAAETDPPTENPTTRPTREPTTRPTREPTTAPTEVEEVVTERPTTAPDEPDDDPEAEATRKPYNPDNTVRLSFTMDYTINDMDDEPSPEEQDNLDAALQDFFIGAVESGGSTSSAMELDSSWVVSSTHIPTATGWQQKAVIEFTFLNGLPPLTDVRDAVENNADIGNYLRNIVKKTIGPTFAGTNSVGYGFAIEMYGSG